MAKIIAFLLCISFLRAEIIETHQMEEILHYVDETTWVLFDLNDFLLEPENPAIVRQVQQSAGAVFGLTARHPPICAATLRRLAQIGIDFTFTAPECPVIESKNLIHWERGVLFLTDFNKKGAIFRKWLEVTEKRPRKVILVDQGKTDLIEMEKEMAALGIPCVCFHYTKMLEQPE